MVTLSEVRLKAHLPNPKSLHAHSCFTEYYSHNAVRSASPRIKPLCGTLAQKIIRCSISFCGEKGFKNCIIYFFYCAVFLRKSFIR